MEMDQAKVNFMNRAASRRRLDVHFAILFSSPLVYCDNTAKKGEEKIKPLQALSLTEEGDNLMTILREAGKQLVVRRDVATVETFGYMVTKGCRAFHYSGHGFHNCLAFENESGALHDLQIEKLKELFSHANIVQDGNVEQVGVRFIFVSACHSEEAGMKFIEAGVPHVVAVDKEQQVEDEAAKKFALTFYRSLFKGATVQQSFDVAKSTISVLPTSKSIPHPDETAKLFLLLPKDAPHDEAIFPSIPDGELEEIDMSMNRLPPFPENLLGRNIDLYKAVELLHHSRLMTIFGEEGIGKSALAKSLAHWLGDRRVYYGGIFWSEMRHISSVDELLCEVLRAVTGSTPKEASNAEICYTVTGLGKCLLVLDDCDYILEKDKQNFLSSVSNWFQHCSGLTVIMTLRKNLDQPAHFVPNGCHVTPLADKDAATLMSRLTRWTEGIRWQDVLSQLDPNTTDHSKSNHLVLLAQTPVMKMLEGNPMKIQHAAAKYNEQPGRGLSELEKILKENLTISPPEPERRLTEPKLMKAPTEQNVGNSSRHYSEPQAVFSGIVSPHTNGMQQVTSVGTYVGNYPSPQQNRSTTERAPEQTFPVSTSLPNVDGVPTNDSKLPGRPVFGQPLTHSHTTSTVQQPNPQPGFQVSPDAKRLSTGFMHAHTQGTIGMAGVDMSGELDGPEPSIDDCEGKEQWQRYFARVFDVPWADFKSHLLKGQFSFSNDTLEGLRGYFVDVSPDHHGQNVTQESFNTFLKLFGPFRESIDKAINLDTKEYFHGSLSLEDCTTKLRDHPSGTFLVRFSNSYKGSFVINFVKDNGDVTGQQVINMYKERVLGGGVEERNGKLVRGYTTQRLYTMHHKILGKRLGDVIYKFRNQLKIPLPRMSNYEASLTPMDDDYEQYDEEEQPPPYGAKPQTPHY